MRRAAIDDVPSGPLRTYIGSGQRVGFAPGGQDPTGRPGFTIEWTGRSFIVRGPHGTHAATCASWDATIDAALAIPRRCDA